MLWLLFLLLFLVALFLLSLMLFLRRLLLMALGLLLSFYYSLPSGPAIGRNRGSVSSKPSLRATENPRP